MAIRFFFSIRNLNLVFRHLKPNLFMRFSHIQLYRVFSKSSYCRPQLSLAAYINLTPLLHSLRTPQCKEMSSRSIYTPRKLQHRVSLITFEPLNTLTRSLVNVKQFAHYTNSTFLPRAADPKFSGPINNVTVPVGRDALLTCIVHDLASFKVAWLRVDTQTILSIQNHVITKNHRIGISHTEHRIWQLRIRDVHEADRGW